MDTCSRFVRQRGASRTREDNESEAVQRRRDAYYVAVERAQKHAETFNKLPRIRTLCRVHFGQVPADAVETVRVAPIQATTRAHVLVHSVRFDGQVNLHDELRRETEAIIWEVEPDDTEVGRSVRQARIDLDRLLSPVQRDPLGGSHRGSHGRGTTRRRAARPLMFVATTLMRGRERHESEET